MKIMILILLICVFGCVDKESLGSTADESYDAESNDADSEFCGISTFGECPCIVSGCSGQVCQGKAEEMIVTTCEEKECYDTQDHSCGCVENRCMWVRR